jgi:hypothetical protein
MVNPVARLKSILGELLLNGRIAVQAGSALAQRIDGLERTMTEVVQRTYSVERQLATHVLRDGSAGRDQGVLDERLSTEEIRTRILTLAARLRPCRAHGRAKLRVGGPHDGGYVMLDDWAGLVGALSIGIGTDDAWDRDVLGRGVSVAQFDHTINAPPGVAPGLAWTAVGIGPEDLNNLRCLRSLVALSGFPAAGDLLLKLDAEAGEWAAMAAGEAAAPLVRFRQIVIELHWFEQVGDNAWFATALRALDHLSRTHGVVHVHANNGGGMALLGGICFPRVLEVTFARRDSYDLAEDEGPFPTPLDTACNPVRPDLYLGSFRFPLPDAAAPARLDAAKAVI